jgi:hypothetical protein
MHLLMDHEAPNLVLQFGKAIANQRYSVQYNMRFYYTKFQCPNFRIPDLVTENWAIQPMIRKI